MSSELRERRVDAVAEISPTNPPTIPAQALSIFNDPATFKATMEMATFLAKSTLVPTDYRNNPSNTMIAIDIASRIGASPLMVMQNLYIVHGRPSWSSQFVISVINACGRFSHLRFEFSGEGDQKRCKAVAHTRDGETLEGPEASVAMAKAEKWYDRAGSKWPTMTDLMLRYRAAAFFGRLYCPDILNGMYTADEVTDFAPPEPRAPRASKPIDVSVSDQVATRIVEGLAALGAKWGSPKCAAHAGKIIGRTVAPDESVGTLTELEGAKLLEAIEAEIAKKKGPSGNGNGGTTTPPAPKDPAPPAPAQQREREPGEDDGMDEVEEHRAPAAHDPSAGLPDGYQFEEPSGQAKQLPSAITKRLLEKMAKKDIDWPTLRPQLSAILGGDFDRITSIVQLNPCEALSLEQWIDAQVKAKRSTKREAVMA